MKKQLTMFLLLLSGLSFVCKGGADDRWETLRAINWVENPTNHTRMGRFGELGPYQFRPATWRMHTKKPFRMAIEREVSDEVAVKHYEWIKRSLEQAGVDATPFNIAMAWNSGVTNVLSGRAPMASYGYAERVTNLVQTLKWQEHVAVAAAPTAKSEFMVITMDKPLVTFAVFGRVQTVDITLPPAPEEPVVHTVRDRVTVAEAPMFTLSTTATLTPRFSLLPNLLD